MSLTGDVEVPADSTEPASLLRAAQAGDPEAFCLFCRPFQGRLLRHAQSVTGQSALAEELTAETFVEAWRSLRRYNGRAQFFTWLCAILIRRHRNCRRGRRPFPFSMLPFGERQRAESLLDSAADHRHLPDEVAERNERSAAIRRSLERLSAKHREVIYLRFYVDESLESIAAALCCSVGTVKSRLFHALEKLRAMRELTSAGPNRS